MVCPHCSAENIVGAKTCNKCQKPLEVFITSSQPAVSLPDKMSNKKLFLLLAVLMLMATSFFAIFKLTSKNNFKSPVLTQPVPVTSSTSALEDETVVNQPQSKYEIDTDYDAISDFVEEALGFSPTENTVKNCALQSCQAPELTEVQATKKNILLVLDSSGSMASLLSGKSKMDIAKEAVRNYVSSLADNKNVTLALMVYGHAGSNFEKDKALSCQTIDLVYPFSIPNFSQFDTALAVFKPTGWTAIGGSLLKAREVFQGKETEKNYVVVISDGIETCGTDPVTAAQQLKNSGINPQIDVIGFAVDAQAKSQLEQVAQIGGGEYFSADTADELDRTLQENLQKIELTYSCAVNAVSDYITCLNNNYIPANKYLTQNLSQVNDNAEKDKLIKSRSLMMKYFRNAANSTDSLIDLIVKSGEDYRVLKEQQVN